MTEPIGRRLYAVSAAVAWTSAGLAYLSLEAVAAAGGEVVSAREYRPTFDEVFAELVQRGQAGDTADDDVGGLVPSRYRDAAGAPFPVRDAASNGGRNGAA